MDLRGNVGAMATVRHLDTASRHSSVLREIEQAEGYVAAICFKTGPPSAAGVELEWTAHDAEDPVLPLNVARLRRALGALAPPEPGDDRPPRPLRHGGMVTLEPGGQVEISSQPHPSLADLHAAVDTELNELIDVLHASGLRLGGTGIDAHRPAGRLLRSPRYDAMAESFAHRGPQGEIMMCSTAGLQVCLDAGPADALSARWAAVHEFGPTLLAIFANSRRYAGHDTGWASARMRAWFGIEPARTRPVGGTEDPAAAWATYALRAPLLCVRRPEGHWHAPPGVTFADWINGALPVRPTVDDLDYHLGTLFPPVRPRGYLEVRYLDAQPLGQWFAPVAVVAALLADDKTVDAVRDICAPAAKRWVAAARFGLADPVLAAVAPAVLDLACRAFDRVGLPASLQTEVCNIADGLLARGRETQP